MLPEIAFDLRLKHGRCVGVRLPIESESVDLLAGTLMEEEKIFASTLSARRRRGWVGGRVAMREALARVHLDAPPILIGARGAPALPPSIAGSISHKEALAVALVVEREQDAAACVGVDVEVDERRRHDIASKVLTEEEAAEVERLDVAQRQGEVLLRFSAKEAIYKALDPFVRRYVSFKEVAVTPRPDGTIAVRARLANNEGPFEIEGHWRRVCDGFLLTTARVEPTHLAL